jgi:hypothetical protein
LGSIRHDENRPKDSHFLDGHLCFVDSAEKPSWSKNPKFLGDNHLAYIAKTRLRAFLSVFFYHRNTIFYNVGKAGGFSAESFV